MTHAAVECAAIIRNELPSDSMGISIRVIALCGGGNNGADGYAIVRTLHSHGIDAVAIEVAQCRPNRMQTSCANPRGEWDWFMLGRLSLVWSMGMNKS